MRGKRVRETSHGIPCLRAVVAMLIVALLFGTAGSMEAAVIYVDGEVNGAVDDGESWETAYTYLQDALTDAEPGDEIWVAEGIYGGMTFDLVDGVALYGGFAGNETSRDQRDWGAYNSILDGEGIRRVVEASGTSGSPLGSDTVLDGFTVTDGATTGNGGGMLNYYSSATIRNCVFKSNSATNFGGGLCNQNSNATIRDCIFEDNQTTGSGAHGGGMANRDSDPLVIDTRFLWNYSAYRGGGMNNYPNSDPTLINVEFIDNVAVTSGGGLNSWSSNNPKLVNVTFFGNSVTSGSGGGIHDEGTGKTTSVTNCIFWANSATTAGTDQIGPASGVDVTYSLVQDGYPGEGNITNEPDFETVPDPGDGDWSTLADNVYGDLRLRPGSPGVDAGIDSAVPAGVTTDLAGNPRFDGVVDMGAYETVQTLPGTVMLDVAMSGKGSGTVTATADGVTEEIYGKRTYDEGTEVTLEATPNQGSFFEAWDGALFGTEKVVSVLMDADKICTAVFGCEAPTAVIVPLADGSTVTLDGTGSYAPGLGDSIASYRWLQTAGGVAVVLSGEDTAEATFTVPEPQPGEDFQLWFELTVTDNHGRRGMATCFVAVDSTGVAVNQPPEAVAVDQTVTELTEVALIGSNSRDDVGVVSYLWRQTSGPDVTLSDPAVADPVFRAPADVGSNGKVLWFELTVADGAGLSDVDTCIVNVTSRVDGSNMPPVAHAGGTQTVVEGDTVTLDGSGSSDPDDNLESFLWIQEAGSAVSLSDTGAANPTFTAPEGVGEDGLVLWFQLIATDEGGLQASDSCAVNVISGTATGVNGPPAARASVSGIQQTAAGIRVTLSGAGSEAPDGGELLYSWKLLSGSSAVAFSDPTMEVTSFIAADATGIYTCRLTVTGSKGLVDTCECVVDLEEEMADGTGSGGNGDGGGGCSIGVMTPSLIAVLLTLSILTLRR